ncbi:signal transduction histidine kinase, lyts [Neobacillus bataviensis LMG 21833]|uniref:Signal transduction histidine kinase, lyts n=1 Tax=Neobacillus bataviensis LMG 21833 TaxID=1117379 RepID=K6DH59_9BACI|nr:sensor histidine kinase [Neobacillus bataviensis]EKN67639.1 signal transduction histidine kinase, lyts [Neobacillus bataviensis LMG 21833]
MNSLKRSFYIKNLIKLLIPMLIPILILGSLAIPLIHFYLKEKINQENLNLLNQIQMNFEMIFDELNSINFTIAASAVEFIDLQNMLEKNWLDREDYIKLASLKNVIDSPALAHPYIDSIYIYIENDKRRFLTSTSGGAVDLSTFEDTSWYEGLFKEKTNETIWTKKRTIIRKPLNFPSQTIEVISLYRCFTLANGNLGYIVLNVNTAYLNDYLNGLYKMPGQNILVIDEANKILFENYPVHLTASETGKMVTSTKEIDTMKIQSEPSIVFKLESEKYSWLFFSSIPKSALYKLPYQLSVVIFILLFLSIIVGGILAYFSTKRNFADIRSIVTILNNAEKGEPLPHLPTVITDVHNYIIHKIVSNFMEQSYMKVRLSERKYKMQALELSMHQSQLNPHFLFNTLETINWKVFSLTKRPNEINDMIDNLANILRYSLDAKDDLVVLRDEIKHTKSYVDIQKIRHKDQFTCIWECDEGVDKYFVVKLFLQPLIENSLQHGMVGLVRKLSIKVKIKSSLTDLYVSVIDNGVGMDTAKLKDIRSKLKSNYTSTDHIGLYNTNKRIQLIYGENQGITFRSKPGWGTIVAVKIPIN